MPELRKNRSAFFALLVSFWVACTLAAPVLAWAEEAAETGDALALQDDGLVADDVASSANGELSIGADEETADVVDAPADDSIAADEAKAQQDLETALLASAAEDASDELQDTGVPMHRVYNPNSGEHFYTAHVAERDFLVQVGWNAEGIGWIAPSSGAPVHRLYNPNAGDHHYTLDEYERDSLVGVGWRYEGIGWFSAGNCAVLRQYNSNAVAGAHNFTVSQYENDYLASVGWNAEGVGWYALADSMDTLISYYATPCATVTALGKDMRVNASFVDDTYHLLLPSYADMASLRISSVFGGEELAVSLADWNSSAFQDVPLGSAVDVASLSTTSSENGARLLLCRAAGTSAIQRLAVMASSAISAVHIESVDAEKGRAYVEASSDHSAKADVRVTVVNDQGKLVYDQDSAQKASTIKGRGNSTWGIGDKKPYQISLSKKADLLETGVKANAQKKWVLLANANDVTMLHNSIAYNLGLELGMGGTECEPVDLYYDGEYRGTYLLCEKVQIQSGRIEIADLEASIEKANPDVDLSALPTAQATNEYGQTYQYVKDVADPSDITGGYLLEIDEAYHASEVCWFNSSWGPIVVKSPEYCSQNAMKYISERFELAAKRLNSEQVSADDGAVIDVDSLAKTYLVSEFAKNIDAFISSTYIYKDAGSASFIVAPLWDFDASMGVRTDWTDTSFVTYQGFVLPHATNATSYRPVPVAKVPTVQDRVRQLWTGAVSPLIKNVLLSTDQNAVGTRGFLRSLAHCRQQIAASQKMNEVLFGLTSFRNEIDPFSTYELNANYLANWLTWRTAWLDGNIDRLSGGSANNAPWAYGGVDYGLVFDARYYVELNKETIGDLGDSAALKSFYDYGMAHGLVASRNFNVNAYKARYSDLRAAFGDDLKRYYLHYITNGFKEGRIAV